MKKKNISSWLFTAAKNAALNYRKKHSREIFEIDENWDSEEDTEKNEAQVNSAEEQVSGRRASETKVRAS